MNEIPDSFIKWLHEQLDRTHFSQSEASRRAGLNQNAISDIVNGKTRKISVSIAIGLGRVFDLPPEDVLRQAKVLPPLPRPVQEEREVLAVLRGLPPVVRTVIVQMLSSLKENYAPVPGELRAFAQPATISQSELEIEIEQFLADFPELRKIIQEAKAQHLSDVAIRALMANVRIVISNPEERLSFSRFHRQLSELFEELATTA